MAAGEAITEAVFVLLTLLRNVIFTAVVVVCVNLVRREGLRGSARKLVGVARLVPGVDEAIAWALKRQVRGFLHQIDPETFAAKEAKKCTLAIPKKG